MKAEISFKSKKEGGTNNDKWLLCPVCKNKTRTRIRLDTTLTNFPLFCPKCKQETMVNVQKLNMTVVKEPNKKS